jgi:hypothetical protein
VTAKVSASRVVYQTRIIASAFTGFPYDVAADGRFLANSLIKPWLVGATIPRQQIDKELAWAQSIGPNASALDSAARMAIDD